MSIDDFLKDLKTLYSSKTWNVTSGNVGFLECSNQKPPPTGDEMNVRTAIVLIIST